MTCRGCGIEFDATSVDKLGRLYKVRRFYCTVECRNNHYIISGKHKNNHIRSNYGLTQFQYEKLVASQKGLCALCDLPLDGKIAVDHDHNCCPTTAGKPKTCGKCIRGLLHEKCNIGLGAFDDNPEKLRKAARYLEVTKAMQPFRVNVEEAIKFSQIWTYKGIHLNISPEECQFAADFANVAINSFIGMCQQQARDAAIKTAEAQKPQIIMEGIK